MTLRNQAARDPLWRKYLRSLSREDRDKILFAAVERLIETNEVKFRIDDNDPEFPDEGTFEECLYWTSCGEDLRNFETKESGVKNMNEPEQELDYDQLIYQLDAIPLTWLPGLLARTAEACERRRVFQEGKLIPFVERALKQQKERTEIIQRAVDEVIQEMNQAEENKI